MQQNFLFYFLFKSQSQLFFILFHNDNFTDFRKKRLLPSGPSKPLVMEYGVRSLGRIFQFKLIIVDTHIIEHS